MASPLVGGMAFECDSPAGFWLKDVTIFGGDGVNAEVPYAEVDGLLRQDLHEGELAEVQGLFWRYFEPVATR